MNPGMIAEVLTKVFLFCRKKNQSRTVLKGYKGRSFTEEDRQAVLLIRELGDIINDVKKTVK